MRKLKSYLAEDIWPIGVIMYMLLVAVLCLASTADKASLSTVLMASGCYWAGWFTIRAALWWHERRLEARIDHWKEK